MKILGVLTLSISLFFTIINCESIVEPIIPNDIQVFVNNLSLDRPQNVEIEIGIIKEDIYIFIVPYGPPKDCPSGCFYSRFTGIKNKSKISSVKQYDIDSTDTYLFSQEFFELLKKKDYSIFYSEFLPLLAADKDTQLPALIAIAKILYTHISIHLGNILINNQLVQANVEILTLLSNLPVFGGDPYKDIRDIAKNLLKN